MFPMLLRLIKDHRGSPLIMSTNLSSIFDYLPPSFLSTTVVRNFGLLGSTTIRLVGSEDTGPYVMEIW